MVGVRLKWKGERDRDISEIVMDSLDLVRCVIFEGCGLKFELIAKVAH
jgi:hypothetical protein